MTGKIDTHSTEEVKNADAPFLSFFADPGVLGRGLLKPSRRHPSVLVPYCCKPFPVASLAPHKPLLDQVAGFNPAQKIRIALICSPCSDFALDKSISSS
jgi:hypothetical protein